MPTVPKLEVLKIDFLRGDTQVIQDDQFANIMKELDQVGQTQPIRVNKLMDDVYEIIDPIGSKILLAAFKLRREYIECLIVNG